AERLGADLARHRFHPLPEVDRGQRHRELAAWVGMDQRLAWVAAKIHSDRIVDRRYAASAKLGHVIASWRRIRTRTALRHATARTKAGAQAASAPEEVASSDRKLCVAGPARS